MASETKISAEIKLILKANLSLQFDESSNKIKCCLSGHEMPCKLDQVQKYLNGKKFKRVKEKQGVLYDKYKPHIVLDTRKGHTHQLYCLLTKSEINKSVEHVERHVNGLKYKKALAEWEANKNQEATKKTEEKEPEETCIIEEEEEDEEESDFDEEGQDDLQDLYPDMEGDDSDDDDDDDEDEKDSHLEKIQPTSNKRKSDFKKEPKGQMKKQKKTRRK